jgi:hypothetical protein
MHAVRFLHMLSHRDSNTQIVDSFMVFHMLFVVMHEISATDAGGGCCSLYSQFIQNFLEYKLK